jgi:hypothetical protein
MEDGGRVVEPWLVSSAAVNERTLLIMAALGASVVAYVVYALMSRGMDEPQPVRVAAQDAPSSDRPAEAPEASTRRPTVKPKLPTARPSAKPSGGPPPPLPMPKVSLEEAREDYDDFMAELERELERNKDTGKPLANEHWVDYYRRGHEIMNPLRRYLSTGADEEKREVGEKDEALRNLMSKLQRDPATLEPEAEDADPEG